MLTVTVSVVAGPIWRSTHSRPRATQRGKAPQTTGLSSPSLFRSRWEGNRSPRRSGTWLVACATLPSVRSASALDQGLTRAYTTPALMRPSPEAAAPSCETIELSGRSSGAGVYRGIGSIASRPPWLLLAVQVALARDRREYVRHVTGSHLGSVSRSDGAWVVGRV
jgi:hypothetical protein